MTATATPTDKEADRRIPPGDGKLNPVNHIVRIVVVRLVLTRTPRVKAMVQVKAMV